MPVETIDKIERSLNEATNLPSERKQELLRLLGDLRGEIGRLSEVDAQRARSIANFADASTHEATSDRRDDNLLDLAVEGLRTTVKGFENEHHKLVDTVNAICTALSNMGI